MTSPDDDSLLSSSSDFTDDDESFQFANLGDIDTVLAPRPDEMFVYFSFNPLLKIQKTLSHPQTKINFLKSSTVCQTLRILRKPLLMKALLSMTQYQYPDLLPILSLHPQLQTKSLQHHHQQLKKAVKMLPRDNLKTSSEAHPLLCSKRSLLLQNQHLHRPQFQIRKN